MIRRIDILPEGVIGFEFSGKITAEDYLNVVFPIIKKENKKLHAVNIICFVKDNIKLSLKELKSNNSKSVMHFNSLNKIAVVSDAEGFKAIFKSIDFLLTCETKFYKTQDMQKAINWLDNNYKQLPDKTSKLKKLRTIELPSQTRSF